MSDKWLYHEQYSVGRQDSISTAIQLYMKLKSTNRMYAEYTKMQTANKQAWLHYEGWVRQFEGKLWPNGKPIEKPDRLLLLFKRITLSREMSRCGIGQGSKYSKREIGDWTLVTERGSRRDTFQMRYNVSHRHPNDLIYPVVYYDHYLGNLKKMEMYPCRCGAMMPRQIEVFARLDILAEKLG